MREIEPRNQFERNLVDAGNGRLRLVVLEEHEMRTAGDAMHDRAMMACLHYGTGDARYDQYIDSNGI